MIIKATDLQMKEMAALAVNAAKPVGMGYFHYSPYFKCEPSDIEIRQNYLDLDYVQGRMVKFWATKVKTDLWKVRDDLDPEYQSWITEFPTWKVLAAAVGAEIVEEKV